MKKPNLSLLGIVFTLLAIAALTLLGPEEKALGSNVRIVYLHGAWVLAAELAFAAAALAGLVGLIARSASWHQWSAALGQAGILFWVTYLPLSLWAMQANWNGLFLAEPRFRMALMFAVVGMLMQAGLWFIGQVWLNSVANIVFAVALRIGLAQAAYVMHPPPSPIFNSGNWGIILFFAGLNILTLLAAAQVARALARLDR